ncbi:MAG: hypothetical protein CVV24_09645 [Ignavibacteriae bacterium HGW-Ignavibacteriae-3]|nr:MAG: hypothetical protein CVV24_09645 [Ignavibacteriae bacterium HGW-Ignavibacteriae-3]
MKAAFFILKMSLMKEILKIFLIVVFLLCLIRCSVTDSESDYTSGTVKFQSIEGGFYGIVTDDNKYLDPLNLSKEFQINGMRILFKYIEKKEMASFHMWGTIVQITDIKELR